MIRSIVLFVVFVFAGAVASSRTISGDVLKLPSDAPKFFGGDADDDYAGTRWAVLIAGSNGYWNYRHQVIPVDSFFCMLKENLTEFGINHAPTLIAISSIEYVRLQILLVKFKLPHDFCFLYIFTLIDGKIGVQC